MVSGKASTNVCSLCAPAAPLESRNRAFNFCVLVHGLKYVQQEYVVVLSGVAKLRYVPPNDWIAAVLTQSKIRLYNACGCRAGMPGRMKQSAQSGLDARLPGPVDDKPQKCDPPYGTRCTVLRSRNTVVLTPAVPASRPACARTHSRECTFLTSSSAVLSSTVFAVSTAAHAYQPAARTLSRFSPGAPDHRVAPFRHDVRFLFALVTDRSLSPTAICMYMRNAAPSYLTQMLRALSRVALDPSDVKETAAWDSWMKRYLAAVRKQFEAYRADEMVRALGVRRWADSSEPVAEGGAEAAAWKQQGGCDGNRRVGELVSVPMGCLDQGRGAGRVT